MQYLKKTFSLPVSSVVSQEEWDRIFNNLPASHIPGFSSEFTVLPEKYRIGSEEFNEDLRKRFHEDDGA